MVLGQVTAGLYQERQGPALLGKHPRAGRRSSEGGPPGILRLGSRSDPGHDRYYAQTGPPQLLETPYRGLQA